MKVLIIVESILMILNLVINKFIDQVETVYVNLFRVNQILSYALSLCFILTIFFIREWVLILIFSTLAIYFFFESLYNKNDYQYWLDKWENDEEEDKDDKE